ncbi:hypothetical protein M8C21_005901, partial [Ambrosia artemisiifolia]
RVLKERFGLDLTQKQIKNAYENRKAKYIRWGHPKDGSLKTFPLPFPELCAESFDGNAATGMHKWTSTQTTTMVGSSSCYRPKPLLIMDTVLHDTEDDDANIGNQTFEPTPDPTSEPTPEPNPKKKAKISLSSISEDELARDMKKALQYLIKGKEGPTIVEEKLKLVGLNPVDPLFLAAYHILGVSSDIRAAWMALPETLEVLKGIIMDYDKKLL